MIARARLWVVLCFACGTSSAEVDAGVDVSLDAPDPREDAGTDAGGERDARVMDAASPPPTAEEEALLLGDDRLGDALRGRFDEFRPEPLEIARAVGAPPDCDRPNVHLAIEAQTRLAGMARLTASPVPRAILTGCAEGSAHEVFVVLTSPDEPEDVRNPLAENQTTEVMALDRGTGLYNFYAIERDLDGFTLRRTLEQTDGSIIERTKSWNAPLREAVNDEGGCLYCHARGTPMLLERNPFEDSPWIAPGEGPAFVGLTSELQNENDGLEALAAAVARGVEVAVADTDSRGYAPRVEEGALVGGYARLLRSVFCPTEYQLANPPAGHLPSALVADSWILGEVLPHLPGSDATRELRQVPVRADVDVAIERYLVDEGILHESTAVAIRLWDPHSDLSRARCDQYWEVVRELPAERGAVDGHVRDVLRTRWNARDPSGERTLAIQLLSEDGGDLESFRAVLRDAAPSAALRLSAAEVDARVVDRVAWMRERFVPPFALNPTIYREWLDE
ncbi:MAG: hypothetical protein AAGE52_33245 [Myxococcota bacterium]